MGNKLGDVATKKVVDINTGKATEVDKLPKPEERFDFNFELPNLPEVTLVTPKAEVREQLRAKVESGRDATANRIADLVNNLRDLQSAKGDDLFGNAAKADLERVEAAITKSLNIPEPYRTTAILTFAKKLIDTTNREDLAMTEDTIRRLKNAGFLEPEKSGSRDPRCLRFSGRTYRVAGEFVGKPEASEVFAALRVTAIVAQELEFKARQDLEAQNKGLGSLTLDQFKAGFSGRFTLFIPAHTYERLGEGSKRFSPAGSALFENSDGRTSVIAATGKLRDTAEQMAKLRVFVPTSKIFANKLHYGDAFDEVRDNLGFCYTLKRWLMEAIGRAERDAEQRRKQEAEEAKTEGRRAELMACSKLNTDQFFGSRRRGIHFVDLGEYRLSSDSGTGSEVIRGCFFAVERRKKQTKSHSKVEEILVVGCSPELSQYLDRFTEPTVATDDDFTNLGILGVLLRETRKRWAATKTETQAEVPGDEATGAVE